VNFKGGKTPDMLIPRPGLDDRAKAEALREGKRDITDIARLRGEGASGTCM